MSSLYMNAHNDNSSHFIYEMCPFSDMAIYGAYTYKCIWKTWGGVDVEVGIARN
jgi:hypothetical protein